jgi:hypothetical protein
VGELDGLCDLEQEAQPVMHGEPMVVRPLGDRLTFHEFRDQVRPTVIGGPAVEQPRDVRVHQPGQDLALRDEPADELVGVEAPAEDLERDALLEGPVRALGLVNGGHATSPDLAHHAVAPDALARQGRSGLGSHVVRGRPERIDDPPPGTVQQLVGGRHAIQQFTNGHFEVGLARACVREKPVPLLQWTIERGLEDPVDFRPPLPDQVSTTRHRSSRTLPYPIRTSGLLSRADSSWLRYARALDHSLSTVRTELPMAAAVSGIESPPKKRHSTIRAIRSLRPSRRRSASSSASRSSAWV